MTDPQEAMAVAAKRLEAHYSLSADEALGTITRALRCAPAGLNQVEAMYWFTAGWMAGRGRGSSSAFVAAPRDNTRRAAGGWKGRPLSEASE